MYLPIKQARCQEQGPSNLPGARSAGSKFAKFMNSRRISMSPKKKRPAVPAGRAKIRGWGSETVAVVHRVVGHVIGQAFGHTVGHQVAQGGVVAHGLRLLELNTTDGRQPIHDVIFVGT